MKNKRIFLTAATLWVCLFPLRGLGGFLYANDTIRMSWTEDYYYQYSRFFGITATIDKQFLLDWGDGDKDTITGTNSWQNFTHIYSSYYKQYTITITGLTEDCKFSRLDCRENNLTDLSLNCMELTELGCNGNELSVLNLSEGMALRFLNCNGNRFSLSECYRLLKYIPEPWGGAVEFGVQMVFPQEVEVGDTVDFSAEAVFNKIPTVFTITKEDSPIPIQASDYTTDNKGIFTFNRTGTYRISMINSAIMGSIHPAEVLADIIVSGTTILDTNASLSALKVTPSALVPNFKPGVTNYVVTVLNASTEITITATASSLYATITGDTGIHQLEVGENIFKITVTAEDGTTKEYKITVTRKVGIEELTINNEQLMINSVEIFDMLGKRYYTPRPPSRGELAPSLLERAGGEVLPAGIYIIKMQTNQGILTKKIIKR